MTPLELAKRRLAATNKEMWSKEDSLILAQEVVRLTEEDESVTNLVHQVAKQSVELKAIKAAEIEFKETEEELKAELRLERKKVKEAETIIRSLSSGGQQYLDMRDAWLKKYRRIK